MYPKINQNDKKAYLYNDFKNGVGKTEDGEITVCRNLYRKNGTLAARPVMSATDTAVFLDNKSHMNVYFELSDTILFGDGEYNRIAVTECTNEMSYMRYEFKLLGSGGRCRDAGSVQFNRVSSDYFIVPHNYTVFSGSPSKGCGVYVIFGGRNYEDKAIIDIYELNSSRDEWLRILPTDTYIPDYYINGRGASYTFSELSLPAPQYKEPINMLNPKFNCYFTSDGISNIYRLPIRNFKLGPRDFVQFTLTLPNGQQVEWRITDESVYDTTQIGEYLVELYLEAKTGFFRFYSNPSGYTIPYSDGDVNNIKVTVCIENNENIAKIAGMTQSMWYASGSSGSRLCLGGNRYYPALVCISQANNPLYFPDSNQFIVGDPSQRVTALGRQNKSVVIFKEKEIYSAYYSSGNFLVTNIHSSIGCDIPQTVTMCDNRLVWTNSGGEVYLLATLSQYSVTAVYRIPSIIPPEEILTAYYRAACSFKDMYMLFIGNRAYVMDYADAAKRNTADFVKSVRWFVWEFPEDTTVLSAFAGETKLTLICTTGSHRDSLFYISDLDEQGSADNYIPHGGTSYVSREVEGEIEVRLFDKIGDHINKVYTDLYLRLYSENDVFVDFIDNKGDTLKTSVINIEYNADEHCRAYRMLPLIKAPRIGLRLRTRGKTVVDGVVYFCKALSAVK